MTDHDKPTGTDLEVRYKGMSRVVGEGADYHVALFGDSLRTPVHAEATVEDPKRLREAMSALYEVVSSDFRYKPKDRTAYLAYQQMRQRTLGMRAWQSQQAYYLWVQVYAIIRILDPVVSVHPEGLNMEVFSGDEGSYGNLSINWDAFKVQGDVKYGTTNMDFSKELFDGLQKIRSYRPTKLSIGDDALSLKVSDEPEVVEKKIQISDSWLRGFLQVQSAATLPRTTINMGQIDLYNILRHLRLNADIKGKGRALRFELVPDEKPRVVLEPWELVIELHGEVYKGRVPQVIRIWGRRRLMLLKRFLPYIENVEVHLLGTGLPSFWVLHAGSYRLTLGFTGFQAFDWSRAVNFDLLLPRTKEPGPDVEKVIAYMKEKWSATIETIATDLQMDRELVAVCLQAGCQQGALMVDIPSGKYRYRPLLDKPLEMDKLTYRNENERQAYDFIALGDVKILTEETIAGDGIELTGQVHVKADRRDYTPKIKLTEEGHLLQAECTCSFFRKNKLKLGPCSHILAIRVLRGKQLEERRRRRLYEPESIIIESRTYVKRGHEGEEVIQLSLDRSKIKVRRGLRGGHSRLQSLFFNDNDQARIAYLNQISVLEGRGYMDASAT